MYRLDVRLGFQSSPIHLPVDAKTSEVEQRGRQSEEIALLYLAKWFGADDDDSAMLFGMIFVNIGCVSQSQAHNTRSQADSFLFSI